MGSLEQAWLVSIFNIHQPLKYYEEIFYQLQKLKISLKM